MFFVVFQAEDGIRVGHVTGVQTCALPIYNVILDVRAGEIVCIYGLMGAGRTELLEAIAGREEITSGEVFFDGQALSDETIAERIEDGLGLVPEDRQRDGLVQSFDVGKNLTLTSLGESIRRGVISKFTERRRSEELIEAVTDRKSVV